MSVIDAVRTRCAVVSRAAAALPASLLLAASALSAQPGPTAIVDRVRIDTRKQIDFHAAAFPETLYVGQQSTYQLAVFLTNEARLRLRRNPEFIPPELRGLLSYELGKARRVLPPNAPAYEALVFQRALFPVAAGTLVVPAPQLSYAMPQSSSYFSREERHLVRAESAHLVVRPLPRAGQPVNFSGAVGVLNVAARLDTLSARVGDPLVLTVQVVGTGNVKLLPRPALQIGWAAAVPGPERVQVDTSGPLVRGTKEFDWVLTPTLEGRVTLPSITYDYFDPYKREYAAAATGPVELEVRSGQLAIAEIGESAALLPLRTTPQASTMGALLQRNTPGSSPALFAALALALVAPLPALALAIRRRRADAPRVIAPVSTVDALRRLHAVDGDAGEGARQARRAFHQALALRLGVAPQLLTSRRQVRRILRRRGVTRDGTDCVIALLDDLDAQGFASAGSANPTAVDRDATTGASASRQGGAVDSFAKRVRDCYAVVDGQAVHDSSPHASRIDNRLGPLLLFAILWLPLGTGVAAQPVIGQQGAESPAVETEAAGAIRAATDSYQQRLFADAEDQFGDLVRADPTNADLLVNWGTAAWAAGDTVHAVIAWQRAARLYPLAADVQQRITLLPAGARGGIANVPMISVPLLRWGAIALWLVGWALAAWLLSPASRNRHGTGLLRGTVWLSLSCAVVAGAASVWGQRALDASALAVVLRPETMHVAPGTDADAMGGVATGDIVQRLEVEGGWQRVLHADGREGWLPSLRLIALSAEEGVRVAVPDGALEPALVPLR